MHFAPMVIYTVSLTKILYILFRVIQYPVRVLNTEPTRNASFLILAPTNIRSLIYAYVLKCFSVIHLKSSLRKNKKKSKKFTEIEEITKQFQITSHRLKLPCFPSNCSGPPPSVLRGFSSRQVTLNLRMALFFPAFFAYVQQ